MEAVATGDRRGIAFGAARLKRGFDQPVGHMAIPRIWRPHGLLHKGRQECQRKQDLAHIKVSQPIRQLFQHSENLVELGLAESTSQAAIQSPEAFRIIASKLEELAKKLLRDLGGCKSIRSKVRRRGESCESIWSLHIRHQSR